jgi:putative DNA primase/helicase
MREAIQIAAAQNGLPAGAARRVTAVRASTVERRPVRFLLKDRIPCGETTSLAGVPGLGKSTWAVMVAGAQSRGELPGDLCGQPCASLIASVEDDQAAVLRPRLEAVQANLDLVHFVVVSFGEDQDGAGLVLPSDIEALGELVATTEARLLVIDPIKATLADSVDSHKDASVRRALAPLGAMARKHDCAILLIDHLNKAPGTDAINRVGGSIGFTGSPRSALLLARDPADPDGEKGDRRLLAHFKSNYGRLAPTVEYRVVPILLEATGGRPECHTSRLEMVGESSLQSSDLLAVGGTPGERTQTDEAVEFLRVELADGPKPAKEVDEAARMAGITEKPLRRAKDHLGVKSERHGFGKEGAWVWCLPHGPDDHVDGSTAPNTLPIGAPIDALDAPSQGQGANEFYGASMEPLPAAISQETSLPVTSIGTTEAGDG